LPETTPPAARNCAPAATRDRDRGLQRLLDRSGIGRVALQQNLGADAVHLRFVPMLLGALGVGERVFQTPELGIDLAGTRFSFGQGRPETGQEPNDVRASAISAAARGS
jgi:hypothetical protein